MVGRVKESGSFDRPNLINNFGADFYNVDTPLRCGYLRISLYAAWLVLADELATYHDRGL